MENGLKMERYNEYFQFSYHGHKKTFTFHYPSPLWQMARAYREYSSGPENSKIKISYTNGIENANPSWSEEEEGEYFLTMTGPAFLPIINKAPTLNEWISTLTHTG
jgi:hypothetical protein